MSVWHIGLLIAILAWGVLCKAQFLTIFCSMLVVYLAAALSLQLKYFNSLQRKVKMMAFNDAGSPSIYASIEVDLTNADDFLSKYNQEGPRCKLTYSHLALASFSRALAESKQNGWMACGAYTPADRVNTALMADVGGNNLVALFMEHTEKRSLPEIAEFYNNKIKLAKTDKLKVVRFQSYSMSLFPSSIIKMLMILGLYIFSDLEMKFFPFAPKQTTKPDVVISNVSSSKFKYVYSAFPAITKVGIIAVLTSPSYRPTVISNQIVQRKILTINLTIDARFYNIVQAASWIAKVKSFWEDPQHYEFLLQRNK